MDLFPLSSTTAMLQQTVSVPATSLAVLPAWQAGPPPSQGGCRSISAQLGDQ